MSLPRIYDLTEAFYALAEEQEALEGSDDAAAIAALYAKWDALESTFAEKIDGTLGLVKELEARRDARKAEAARISARAKVDDAVVKRLRKLVVMGLEASGAPTLETVRFRATAYDHGTAPLVQGPGFKLDDLPPELVKTTVTKEPDEPRIRALLVAGQKVPHYFLGAPTRALRVL